jgi:hypothetical protein
MPIESFDHLYETKLGHEGRHYPVSKQSAFFFSPETAKYDTGGYTGDWNSSEGRMAMLHEKEIILNKSDTANFLDALEILRSLNMSMLQGLGKMGAISAFGAAGLTSTTPIEQNVHITAEFPNVSVRAEIEAAFNNLIDEAIQYTHSSKR